MSYRSYAPYRGYGIEVQVTPAKTLSFHGVGHRYRASWTISSPGHLEPDAASFPDCLEFMSEEEALRYGEKRAHTFIDCIISEVPQSRVIGEYVWLREPAPNSER
jgi:hypothetical protein